MTAGAAASLFAGGSDQNISTFPLAAAVRVSLLRIPLVISRSNIKMKVYGALLASALLSLVSAKTHLLDTFTEQSFKDWVTSDWKGAENMGKWDISAGDWNGGKFASFNQSGLFDQILVQLQDTVSGGLCTRSRRPLVMMVYAWALTIVKQMPSSAVA
jgi:hypothetical protein